MFTRLNLFDYRGKQLRMGDKLYDLRLDERGWYLWDIEAKREVVAGMEMSAMCYFLNHNEAVAA